MFVFHFNQKQNFNHIAWQRESWQSLFTDEHVQEIQADNIAEQALDSRDRQRKPEEKQVKGIKVIKQAKSQKKCR